MLAALAEVSWTLLYLWRQLSAKYSCTEAAGGVGVVVRCAHHGTRGEYHGHDAGDDTHSEKTEGITPSKTKRTLPILVLVLQKSNIVVNSGSDALDPPPCTPIQTRDEEELAFTSHHVSRSQDVAAPVLFLYGCHPVATCTRWETR